eukprot:200834-Hanusia_phi.AAC.6
MLTTCAAIEALVLPLILMSFSRTISHSEASAISHLAGSHHSATPRHRARELLQPLVIITHLQPWG